MALQCNGLTNASKNVLAHSLKIINLIGIKCIICIVHIFSIITVVSHTVQQAVYHPCLVIYPRVHTQAHLDQYPQLLDQYQVYPITTHLNLNLR